MLIDPTKRIPMNAAADRRTILVRSVRPAELAEDVSLSTNNSSPGPDNQDTCVNKKSRPTIAERQVLYQEKTPVIATRSTNRRSGLRQSYFITLNIQLRQHLLPNYTDF